MKTEENQQQEDDKNQDRLFQFLKDLHQHRNDARKLGEIQSLTMYEKKNAETPLDDLLMKDDPKNEDEEFLLGKVGKYDRRFQLVKRAIEKASGP
ncbi:unnamed protein product [Rotaria socialis]|uniref:Uncharacterized protein n=2 Tax=Rotaria socialis TaxID=392032 RepID=A0A817YYB0_9BILA|nr:unnamed protein product [Rotaria socialis]CAF3465908.1 unnamed protein product [Rotaria socialis]CAF3803199.1 unnamed protein product [Rotaria socialis]CAF4886595.1 unnamed protein product [Rotaria socialis]